MYALSTFIRPAAARRHSMFWQAPELFFRTLPDAAEAPMRARVQETDGGYVLEAEVPGFSREEIDVSVQDGVLTIRAAHGEADESGEKRPGRALRRSYTLEGIDEENIAAQCKNGVLTLTLPREKTPDAPEARKIEIGE